MLIGVGIRNKLVHKQVKSFYQYTHIGVSKGAKQAVVGIRPAVLVYYDFQLHRATQSSAINSNRFLITKLISRLEFYNTMPHPYQWLPRSIQN
jgi:hypothetical protein